ncbi:uncharacterized protein LOC106177842 [Lingula anatina]|uniref:Uncharacterized protein LOC106177842 n=1 Tax=Lingula anatina TaxID=7574 RepID=A0A1S3K1Q3_LINAN|nr:uncharacterized protein LOC106177842 [Lingula anatina]|eukprot:XP_013416201.1 uncharacterized protein LOC106177842 [Lingula anatina]
MARRSRVRLTSTLLVLQALFIILFAVFVDYDIDADAKYHPYVSDPSLFHLSDASAAARDGGGSSQNDGDSVTYNGKKSKTGWHIRMVSNSDVAAPPTSNAGTSNAGDAATAETEDRGVNGSGSDGERKRRQISAPTFKNATANESVPLTTESTTADRMQWVYTDTKANKLKSYYPSFYILPWICNGNEQALRLRL